MKTMAGIFLLMCIPLAAAKNGKAYPKEKVAEFVIEKLDITSIPAAIRPKQQKGKKTFGDYGYTTVKVEEKETLVENARSHSQIAITVLEEKESAIYVCLSGRQQNQGNSQIQRVFLLKLSNGNERLKGRESLKEFESCPVIGGSDSDAVAGGY